MYHNLPKNFLEFSQKLNEHKVKYLLLVGETSAFGYDLLVEASEGNTQRMSRATYECGIDRKKCLPDLFMSSDSVFEIHRVPSPIYIYTSIKGMEFKMAYKRQRQFELAGVKIPFVHRKDLL